MSAKNLRSIEDGLNGIAKKVLSVVPIREAWSIDQIVAEMFRQTRSTPDKNVVQGCLEHFVDVGIAKRIGALFQRVEIKEKRQITVPVSRDAPAPSPAHEGNKPEEPQPPVDRLGSIAAQLRGIASQIEDVALDVASKSSDTDKEAEKLRTLKKLLKDL